MTTKNSETGFTIVDAPVPTEVANPYSGAVTALIDAGEGKALAISVPRGRRRDGTPGDGVKARSYFQRAANKHGYTARIAGTSYDSDETMTITFVLSEMRKRKGSTDATSPDTIDDVATE